MARQLIVELVGKSDKFTKTLDDAGHKTGGFGSKIAGVTTKLGPYIAGAAAVGGALFALTKMAAEDEAAQAKLALTLQNTVGATDAVVKGVEKQIEKFMEVSTFTDDALRPAFQNLVVATKDVDKANKLMATAMDIATARGLPLEQVTLAMAKAHDGNTGALSRLGLQTKDAEGKTKSFEQIMADANQVFGGQAQAAAETTAGKMQNLRRDLGELGEKVGAALIPIFAAMAEFLVQKVVPAIEKLWRDSEPIRTVMVGHFKALWEAIQTMWDIVKPILDKLWGALDRVFDIAKKVGGVIGDVTGAVGGVIGKIPGFEHGGVVPGIGPQLAVVHGGETIIPAGRGGGGTVVNISVSSLDPQGAATAVMRAIDSWESSNGKRFARA